MKPAEQKIRRGIDCVCDEKYWCGFHFSLIKKHGIIGGVVVSILLLISMWYFVNLP